MRLRCKYNLIIICRLLSAHAAVCTWWLHRCLVVKITRCFILYGILLFMCIFIGNITNLITIDISHTCSTYRSGVIKSHFVPLWTVLRWIFNDIILLLIWVSDGLSTTILGKTEYFADILSKYLRLLLFSYQKYCTPVKVLEIS